MRRKPRDMQFGSDSFLDVLANMVGILIILIVITGARVGRAPIPKLRDILAQRELAAAAPIEPPSPIAEASASQSPAAAPGNPDPSEMLNTLAGLEAEARQLASASDRHARELEQIEAEATELAIRQETEADRIARQTTLLVTVRQRTDAAQAAILVSKQRLQGLLADCEVAASTRNVEQIVHRTTPISRDVGGEEIHFRLAGGRVTPIPLPELLTRLRSQIDRQKQVLAASRSYSGTVGPVDGYVLQFAMERQSASPFDEIRHGPGVFRVGVSAWKLIPDPDLDGETADQALRRGSRFVNALRSAPPRATITLWVYPDSYGLYRRLQTAVHDEGFTVAARPLPHGVPIAGSPNGTKSAGQ